MYTGLQEKNGRKMKNKNVFALSMTVLWSVVFATSMHDWTIGICLGICIGMAFGLFQDDEKKENENEEE